MSVDITIFTPTYNRKNRLKRLKESLDRQSDFNFTWFIVDDGSTDGTKEMVSEFLEDSMYPIQYHYQLNQGKHVAHNYAVSHCKTELFYCVDSDDKVPIDVVEKIKLIWQNVRDKEKVSGIIGLKAYFDSQIIGNKYPDDIKRASLTELYSVYGKQGDTALIWRTEVIKNYPFRIFQGEKFLRENTAYDLIDKKYKLVITNEILYYVEYCDDGLSRNATQNELKNPLGAAFYRYGEAMKAKSVYKKIAYLSAFVFYCKIGNKQKEAKKQLGSVRYLICKILSGVMFIRYRRRGIKVD